MDKLNITLEDLSVGYGQRVVVSGIDARFEAGRITVVLGGSGSGKSTLLRHVLGLNPAMAGRVLFGESDLAGMSPRELKCFKTRIGVLFQDGALLGSLTLEDNVALPLNEHTRMKKKDIKSLVMSKLELVGLGDFASYYPSELSGGMRKRAGLARAMVMDPAMLFCDEPTSGLDPVNSASLDQLLLGLNRKFGMGMVVVSHDLASTFAIADHILVLGRGRVLFGGTPAELKQTDDEYLRDFLDRRAKGPELGGDKSKEMDRSTLKEDCGAYFNQ